MDAQASTSNVVIKPFVWEHWAALWQLHAVQLVEIGIDLDPLDPALVPSRDSEQDAQVAREYGEDDLHFIAETYLHGGGGFWMAWEAGLSVGSVGAQDLGGVLELRRMYVRAEFRRLGVGTRLVRALIDHGSKHGMRAVELWTAPDGPGRSLYQKLGFHRTHARGSGFEQAQDRPAEIRMRLELEPC